MLKSSRKTHKKAKRQNAKTFCKNTSLKTTPQRSKVSRRKPGNAAETNNSLTENKSEKQRMRRSSPKAVRKRERERTREREMVRQSYKREKGWERRGKDSKMEGSFLCTVQ